MPPEQIRDFRNVKPTADIYAIGMTAYSFAGDIALDLGPRRYCRGRRAILKVKCSAAQPYAGHPGPIAR
jgi:hypothetical protein